MTRKLKQRLGRGLACMAPGVTLALTLAGCATAPPKSDTAAYQAYQEQNDPLEPTNRVFFKVNNTLDTYFMKPIAQGYTHVTTQGMRNHVGDFTSNIGEPARMLNFMAGGYPRDAGTSMLRFIINSTAGVGGFFDPASALGLKKTDTDFGLTLASWGAPPGPYLYLPFFGPSGARDFWNLPVQWFATPMEAAPESTALNDFGYSEMGIHLINTRAQLLGTIDQINATALDPYATFRSLYRQSRESQMQQIQANNKRTWPNWYPPQAQ
ncbi:VacJ family lipoprotein [Acidocella sp.]|uniref:MlaA family lipoprotein n=1 Tax=Acidocella sp. TaxID=50710 RepID=UPI002630768D|nr:VacJ family lipoprotein [Acidocella sp.]